MCEGVRPMSASAGRVAEPAPTKLPCVPGGTAPLKRADTRTLRHRYLHTPLLSCDCTRPRHATAASTRLPRTSAAAPGSRVRTPTCRRAAAPPAGTPSLPYARPEAVGPASSCGKDARTALTDRCSVHRTTMDAWLMGHGQCCLPPTRQATVLATNRPLVARPPFPASCRHRRRSHRIQRVYGVSSPTLSRPALPHHLQAPPQPQPQPPPELLA